MLLHSLALGVSFRIFSICVFAQPLSPTQPAATLDPKVLADVCGSEFWPKYHAYPMKDRVRCYSVRGPATGGTPVNCPMAPSVKGERLTENTFAVIEDKGQLNFVINNLDAINAVLFINVTLKGGQDTPYWPNGDVASLDLGVLGLPDTRQLSFILQKGGLVVYEGKFGDFGGRGIHPHEIPQNHNAIAGKVLCFIDVQLPSTTTTGKEGPTPPPPTPGFWQKYGIYIIIGLVALVGVILVVTLATVLYRRFCRRRRFKRKKKKHGDTTESARTTSESTESEE